MSKNAPVSTAKLKQAAPIKLAARFNKLAQDAERRRDSRVPRVPLAPGIRLTTVLGSLYTTLCKIFARLGHLDQHDLLFGQFQRNPTGATAQRILQRIGIPRAELEEYLRADDEYADHCESRTAWYRKRRNAGDKHAAEILRNPKICRPSGHWAGDIDEALSILRGAREKPTPEELEWTPNGNPLHRNVRILRQAHLLFNIVVIAGQELCFLYRERHHLTFRRAVALAK